MAGLSVDEAPGLFMNPYVCSTMESFGRHINHATNHTDSSISYKADVRLVPRPSVFPRTRSSGMTPTLDLLLI